MALLVALIACDVCGVIPSSMCVQLPVVTEVEEVKNYNSAETYHQQYLSRGGRYGKPQDPSKGCNDPIRCYG
jgi:peptide methionine sulfoxide reductase MsrA